MDEADLVNDDLERLDERAKKHFRNLVKSMPIGKAGECIRCGKERPRLVNDVCARCRDKYKLT